MYITIRRYKGVDTARLRENMKTRGPNEGVAPMVSNIPGFESYYLVDTSDGGVAAISIFLDEAEAHEATDTALAWVQENLSDIVPNPPELIAGEVIASATK